MIANSLPIRSTRTVSYFLKSTRLCLAVISTLWLSPFVQSQEVFSEVNVNFHMWRNEKWDFTVSPTWKHIYDEVGWRRIGCNFGARRMLGNWDLLGGLDNLYRFDKQIDNFYELRPWVGIGLKTPVFNWLVLNQRLKSEHRTFFFGDGSDNTSYGRARYSVGLDFILSKSEEDEQQWKIRTNMEWYFVKNPINRERFADHRELGIKVMYTFPKGHELGLGYTIEQFYPSANHETGNGHIFVAEFSF